MQTKQIWVRKLRTSAPEGKLNIGELAGRNQFYRRLGGLGAGELREKNSRMAGPAKVLPQRIGVVDNLLRIVSTKRS